MIQKHWRRGLEADRVKITCELVEGAPSKIGFWESTKGAPFVCTYSWEGPTGRAKDRMAAAMNYISVAGLPPDYAQKLSEIFGRSVEVDYEE